MHLTLSKMHYLFFSKLFFSATLGFHKDLTYLNIFDSSSSYGELLMKVITLVLKGLQQVVK